MTAVSDRVQPQRRRRFSLTEHPIGPWIIRAATLVAILGVWEVYGRSVNRALFAPPSRVVEAFHELAIESPRLWVEMGDSLRSLAVGFVAAIVVGTFLGLLMGRFRLIEYVLDPYVSFLYALPTVAIVPLLIIWLGIGITTRVAIVFSISIVPILLNTMTGAKRISEDHLAVARNYEATQRQVLRTVVLPGVFPYILAGINVGIGSALIGMVLGEMLIVIRGLGGLVVEFSNFFQPAKVFVALLAIVAISVTLTWGLKSLRRRIMPWSEV